MLRDLARWLLYSPRRLVGVVVTVAVFAGVAFVVLSGSDADRPTRHTTAATPASTSSSDAPSSTSEDEGTERTASPRVLLKTARKFIGSYVIRSGSPVPRTMPTRLRKLTTPALWQGLQLTQPSSLPRGSVEQLDVEDSGPFTGAVTAELDSGRALSISVVAWQTGWRVSDVRPADAR